jgi:hypothetical protein
LRSRSQPSTSCCATSSPNQHTAGRTPQMQPGQTKRSATPVPTYPDWRPAMRSRQTRVSQPWQQRWASRMSLPAWRAPCLPSRQQQQQQTENQAKHAARLQQQLGRRCGGRWTAHGRQRQSSKAWRMRKQVGAGQHTQTRVSLPRQYRPAAVHFSDQQHYFVASLIQHTQVGCLQRG